MEKKSKSMILVIAGIGLFLASMIILLPIPEFYLLALLIMFGGVILIGVGGALVKGFDSSFEIPKDDCYYCSGNGKVKTEDGFDTCPRCGGTGLARPNDS